MSETYDYLRLFKFDISDRDRKDWPKFPYSNIFNSSSVKVLMSI